MFCRETIQSHVSGYLYPSLARLCMEYVYVLPTTKCTKSCGIYSLDPWGYLLACSANVWSFQEMHSLSCQWLPGHCIECNKDILYEDHSQQCRRIYYGMTPFDTCFVISIPTKGSRTAFAVRSLQMSEWKIVGTILGAFVGGMLGYLFEQYFA
jgi:hypothetical protein